MGVVTFARSQYIWTPASITGYRVGLEPDTILESGGYIYQWSDKWGTNHFVNAAGSTQPAYISDGGASINNLPVARFSELKFLKNASLAINQPCTFFVIYKITSNTTCHVFDGQTSLARLVLYYYTNSNIYMTTQGISQLNYGKSAPFDFIYNTSVFNTTSSVLYENGTSKASGGVGNYNATGIVLGNSFNLNAGLIGDIAGLYIYDGVISAGDRALMDTYIQNKYL